MKQRLAVTRHRVRERVVNALAQILRDANARAALPVTADVVSMSVAAKQKSMGREVLVHFTGNPVNLYQLRPWFGPLMELNEVHPVLLVTQNSRAFSVLTQMTPLPVANAVTPAEFEVLTDAGDFAVCFYVSHHSGNFRPMRVPDMFHVNIGHGESDKLYMASNQAKAYDYMFVAGDAAVERYEKNLIKFDTSRLIKIGRPQLDFAEPCLPVSQRPTVLYAPTWEGDRLSMRYSSVVTYGVEIFEQLLDPRHGFRVILRPHPFIGSKEPGALDQLERMRELLADAVRRDPAAGHAENVDDDFTSLAVSADVLVADNSAVLGDFLATGKPFFVTMPETAEAVMPAGGIWEVGYGIDRSSVDDVGDRITEALQADTRRDERLGLVEHYFGDITSGRATERFIAATSELIAERNQLVKEKYERLVASGDVDLEVAAGRG